MSKPIKRLSASLLLVGALFGLSGLPSLAWATGFQPFQANSRQGIEQAHANKAIIMAFWSVDCAYCAEDLATLGEVARQRPDIVLVTVNTDQNNAVEAEKFLDEIKLQPHERWQFGQADADRLRYSIDRNWYGELPRTYFYNLRHEVQAVSGKPAAAWLKRWLKSL